jgi:hypothetical protein
VDGVCRINEKDEKCIQKLIRNSEGRRRLGRSKNIWKVNTKVGLEFVYYKKSSVKWIELADCLKRVIKLLFFKKRLSNLLSKKDSV